MTGLQRAIASTKRSERRSISRPCHEAQGRLASAWVEFNQVAALAKRRGDRLREDFARPRSARLHGRFPTLRINLDPASPVVPALELDARKLGTAD